MSMIPPRLPFVIHWPDRPRPDLSGFANPIRIPFRTDPEGGSPRMSPNKVPATSVTESRQTHKTVR